jgi:putative FmdB family regulatory protein
MPIYAYKCASCGHADDVMQKISAAPLTDCPKCGKATYSKQVTAAGFHLKGGGWYVTDFRSGSKASSGDGADAGKANADAKSDPKSDAKAETKVDSQPAAGSESKSEPTVTKTESSPAPSPSTSSAPATN